MKRRNSGIPTRPLKLWQDSVRSEEARIEILPLIDVIFCILVFFILAAVGISRQQGIDLDLPKASTASATLQEMLVVSLDNEGNVYVEEKQIYTQNQLFRQLSQYFIANPNGIVALNASRKVDYNEVVELLDMLRLVGGDRVALSTSPGYPDRSVFLNLEGTGKGEQGTENKEQGTENKEQGTENKEQGTENKEQGTENKEQGTENKEQGTENKEL